MSQNTPHLDKVESVISTGVQYELQGIRCVFVKPDVKLQTSVSFFSFTKFLVSGRCGKFPRNKSASDKNRIMYPLLVRSSCVYKVHEPPIWAASRLWCVIAHRCFVARYKSDRLLTKLASAVRLYRKLQTPMTIIENDSAIAHLLS